MRLKDNNLLSILIPIFNFDVTDLVTDLSAQSECVSKAVEILCIDDGSSPNFKNINNRLSTLPNVRYFELEFNIGRARIRNRLAREAKFDFLLFLDSDSKIINPSFLSDYLTLLPTKSVLMGGRVYAERPPVNPDLYLHWYYGKYRESMDVDQRRIQPHHHFMTNNFMISKTLFFSVPMDEDISGYGHEDTLWGFALKEKGVEIEHINNAILHLGLEKKAVFLQKAYKAVENLYLIYKSDKDISTKLLRSYIFLKRCHLVSVWFWIICPFRGYFEQKVLAKTPKLIFLDMLKLCKFISMAKNS